MKEYLKNYIEEADKIIEEGKITNKIIDKHLIKINFFQHERLIHLIVTVFYALFLFISVYVSTMMSLFIIIVFIIIIFLIFYVKHYFFLENGVQYLYKQYDKMLEINKKSSK